MAGRGKVTTERMDGAAAVRAASAFRLIYAEAFAGPPYFETGDAVAAAFRRFPRQAGSPGFRAALARTGDGEPVGMAYGHPVPADTSWWRELTVPVPEEVSREDGRRTFGLMELAVRERWRGHGVARRLHATLLDGLGSVRRIM
ncbi:GNAT family N-acetyltransferase [Streptomyces albidoflavus]|uniref:GNAT family N-acetyltransferase n=1 Tax=Streptomyces albidoflavus TaxID=1886 RepID=UPI0033D8471F